MLRRFIRNFSKQTTIHGLQLIGLPGVHIVEKIFWIVVVTTAALGAISIAYSNWIRYSANPTVVSIQKDFRKWENPFPAATGCFVDKTDEGYMDRYIFEKWGVNRSSNHSDYKYYSEFVTAVTNISFETLHKFEKFIDDERLKSVDMKDLVEKVHPKLTGTLVNSDANHKLQWNLILTELGVCFSVNSKLSRLLRLRDQERNDWQNEQKYIKCPYLNGLCYARYDSDPKKAIQYYIHSPYEAVHATVDPPLLVGERQELEINYRLQQTESAPSLRDLSPNQRRCRFAEEPQDGGMALYTLTTCYMACRHKMALRLCACKPFFYHVLPGKVCNAKGLACLSKYEKNLTGSPTEIGCKCPQPCDFVSYFPQVPKYTKWEYGYFDQRITFRWGIIAPTTKFHRDVLFGFEDLIVSFGGTLALFWGVSFISAVETLFLIVENIYSLWMEKKSGDVKNQTRKPSE